MRRVFLLVRLPLFLTLVLAIVLLVDPGRAELAVHVYVLVLAAIGLGHLFVALRSALPPRAPSAFDAALRARTRPAQRIPELERMEREVALGLATAFDLHYRLRPNLRGIDLDASPEAAHRVLGDDAWEIVRGDREVSREHFAPGVDLASLRRAVSALEGI